MLGHHCRVGIPLVVETSGCSLVAVLGLLIVVASLVEHRLMGSWA